MTAIEMHKANDRELVLVTTNDPDKMEELRILAEDDEPCGKAISDNGESVYCIVPVEYVHFHL